ncbi:MAG: hypothetical protein ACI31G_02185 [Bacilli bacterium]
MITKDFVVPESNKEVFRYEKESFGYIYKGETPEGENVKMVFTINKKMPNYSRLKKIEKDYYKLDKKVPLLTIIMLILGIAGIIAYICTYKTFNLSYIFLICAVLFISLGLMSLFTFFYIMSKSSKLKEELLSQARLLIGNILSLPLPGNVKNEIESTCEIRKSIQKSK